MSNSSPQWDQVLASFQKIWGYKDFRSPQGEVISALLAQKDALVILPTGAGKSVCFQLPALLQKGLTIVVSPLIALMENQVAQLQQRQQSALLLHSELPNYQRRLALQAVVQQQSRLLYLSPETLLTLPVWEILSQPHLKINGLIIDEAHCLVQWGETFRPEYRRLGTVRSSLLKNKPSGTKIPVAAFTATADVTTRAIIQNTMKLDQPQEFVVNPYRQNLNLSVKIALSPRCRRHLLWQFIKGKPKQPGLVYVRSRREAEDLVIYLNSQQYPSAAYHAGLGPQPRRNLEASWLSDQVQILVCTSAFGMGIDKPNLRWVVHFHAPLMLLEYLQEVGRCGRDGLSADCLTLVSEPTGLLNPDDKRRREFFQKNWLSQAQKALKIAPLLPPQGSIEAVSKEFVGGEIALSLLHCSEQLEWLDPFSYQCLTTKNKISLREFTRQSQRSQAQMVSYLYTRECRWRFLLQAFGFVSDAQGFRCGHCDNCSRKRRI